MNLRFLPLTLLVASAATMILTSGAASDCCSTPPQVDTIIVTGQYLDQPMKVTVAVPSSYLAEGDTAHYPIVYLLNGHGGNHKSWSTLLPLDSAANAYECIFVCPSGMNSWYWDSPEVPGMQMESFFVNELIPYIDQNYRTRTDRAGRAITGFSMGGHGAFWLSWRHPELFGSAGAMSGGVNIMPFPTRWNMPTMLGEQEANPERWAEHTVINIVDTLEPGTLNLIFDCGTEDFFYDVNCQLDSALNARKIHHVYITNPGAHTGPYWSKSIYPHLDFFRSHWQQPAMPAAE
ncbi:MAG: esterase family protein [Bacteroidales bacterium]|nr:esterase family protein [Bacteroidales bacterium]